MTSAIIAFVVGAGADAGKPAVLSPHDAGPPETAGQHAARNAYTHKTILREMEVTRGHVWTPEVGAVESRHWRRAYRALRIRDLAEDDRDTAAIARVDTFLTRLDQHFFTNLAVAAADAPVIPPAPTLLSPASGASIPVNTATTFKLSPVPGATSYACTLWEPGGHHWSNYDPVTKKFGALSDCTIAASDPRWAQFANGTAHFNGRAITPAKSKKGVDYTIWSHAAQINVTITGSAVPTAASSGTSAPAATVAH